MPKAAARAFWSGTITFGLVSIPVDFFAAVQGRQTTMKMADTTGHALGREYYSDEHEGALGAQELVRGYETEQGKMVVITDEDLESVAPELTRDIEIRVFVPKHEIPPAYFERPYFLAPSGRSQKAYQLLSRVMQKTGRIGVGTFVMRGKQYLVAIISDGAVLRAETLRFAGELRSPKDVGLPKHAKAQKKAVKAFATAIEGLTRDELDRKELSDQYAEAIEELVAKKRKRHEHVVHLSGAEADEEAEDAGDRKVVDLMKVLKQAVAAPGRRAAKRPARRHKAAHRRQPGVNA